MCRDSSIKEFFLEGFRVLLKAQKLHPKKCFRLDWLVLIDLVYRGHSVYFIAIEE